MFKKNILIVDDSPEIQMLLKLLLESKGHHIDCSSNGEEALSLLDASTQVPDLIILDLQMPIMDGHKFLRLRKEDPRLKDIPVILMSGEEDVGETGTMQDVTAVLKKPLTMMSVVRAVESNTKLH